MKALKSPPKIITTSPLLSYQPQPTTSNNRYEHIHKHLNTIRESHNIYRTFIPNSSSQFPKQQQQRISTVSSSSTPSQLITNSNRLTTTTHSVPVSSNSNSNDLMQRINTISTVKDDHIRYVATVPNQNNLAESLRNIRSSNNELRSEKIDNEKNFINIQNETNRLKRDIEKAKRKKQSLEEINNELQHNYGDINSKFNKENLLLEQVFQKSHSDFQSNTSQIEVLAEMNSNLKKTKNDYESLLNELKGTVAILTKKQETFEYNHSNAQKILSDKGAISTEKDNKINQLLEINNQLTKELEMNESNLQKELDSFAYKEKNIQSISQLQMNVNKRNTQLESLYKELMKKDEDIETLKTNYAKINQQLLNGTPRDDIQDNSSVKNIKPYILTEKERTMKELYNKEIEKKSKLVNTLKELNEIYQKLISSQETMKTYYENEINKVKDAFHQKHEKLNNVNASVNVNTNVNGNDKEHLQQLIQEHNNIKQDYELLISKVKELPQLENEFRDIVNSNIELKKQNEILKKAKQLYILKAQQHLLEMQSKENEI